MSHSIPKPIETKLTIPGLARPVTILHITDLHASVVGEEEARTMTQERLDYCRVRIDHFSGGRSFKSHEALPALLQYAAEIQADMVLLTGDILDFPSEANLTFLKEQLAASTVPVVYITGNHDWSFADDYQTPNAAATYLPRMDELSGGDHMVVMKETDDIILFALDNGVFRIPAEASQAYRAAVDHARAVGKPLILALHIPMRVDTLIEDTVRVWKEDLCVGENACAADDPVSMRFWQDVTRGTDYAPAAVIAGHLHFSHEDVFPNGVTQLITELASGGVCRVVRLMPENG